MELEAITCYSLKQGKLQIPPSKHFDNLSTAARAQLLAEAKKCLQQSSDSNLLSKNHLPMKVIVARRAKFASMCVLLTLLFELSLLFLFVFVVVVVVVVETSCRRF